MNRWEGLDEFVAVAETGQFTAAAERMGVSSSHISRQVARLEERLQTRLLYDRLLPPLRSSCSNSRTSR
ncbi:LysR family transcriptional regulator, partial [Pseudomonas aeruginosa]|uniref:helix-turn-helix domain-containing protein n=1 Tax=Pseudomonas aeruginosa TaxID=287 RepID=UPI003968F98F